MSDPTIVNLGKISGTNLREVLDAIAGAARTKAEAEAPKRTVAEDIAALEAAAERYVAPCPFKPRDLVTPRADGSMKGAGRPHIVLEVIGEAPCCIEPVANGNPSSPDFGKRLDMRVAETCACGHGEISAYWVESWEFERYTPPAETGEQAPVAPLDGTILGSAA